MTTETHKKSPKLNGAERRGAVLTLVILFTVDSRAELDGSMGVIAAAVNRAPNPDVVAPVERGEGVGDGIGADAASAASPEI